MPSVKGTRPGAALRITATYDLATVSRFRYQIMSMDPLFSPTEAWRASGQMLDHWDNIADVWIAEDSEGIQGTFRIIWLLPAIQAYGYDVTLGAFSHLGIDRALQHSSVEEIGIAGRLMISPNHRGTLLLARLLNEALRHAVARKARLCIADCHPRLLPLYSRLAGFFQAGPAFHDPNLGPKIPIMGVLGDSSVGGLGRTRLSRAAERREVPPLQ